MKLIMTSWNLKTAKWIPALLVLILVPSAYGHGISESQQHAILEGGNLQYLWLGAMHMVTGYDHLLFLFGVIFYLTGLKDILKFVTAFTIGHSITLILATFMKITADYFLVDAVIALSVCYKAFDNLDGFRKYLKVNPPHLLAMILVFGLIHGFGLSTRLQQLPLPEQGLLTRILSFNVGVELGQVGALSVLVLLLAGWRRTASFRKLGGIANILLLAAGAALFIFQMTGYFRGEDPHHEDAHGREGHGHSHEAGSPHAHEADPALDQREHTHEGGPAHTHEDAGHGQTGTGAVHEEETTHDHGDAPRSHGIKTYGHPSVSEEGDSAGAYMENADPAPVHEHSQEEGHSHGHTHSHGESEGMPPKRPPPAESTPHSHDEGVPHEH
jgi:hypothetical protein